MMFALSRDEIADFRRRRRCCVCCGWPLPNYREVGTGRAHRCFACAWYWMHGVWPSGWRTAA